MILQFPDIQTPRSEQWDVISNTQEFPSDLNRATQTRELPGAQWHMQMTFNDLDTRDGRRLAAFVASLRGRAGRFEITPSDWEPIGTVAGTPTLSADASSLATTLQTTGWDPDQPLVFAMGDYLEINGELKYVTQDTPSDANGDAAIQIMPPVRVGVASGTSIVVEKPKALMMLKSDSNAKTVKAPRLYSMTLSAKEAIES